MKANLEMCIEDGKMKEEVSTTTCMKCDLTVTCVSFDFEMFLTLIALLTVGNVTKNR